MVKAVALGLGKVLKEIAQLLLEVAVEAAAPGLGWAKLALTAYDRVEKIVQMVRIASALIEAAFDAVATFAEAQAMALGEVGRFEDLTEGVVRRAGQAARS
jgi:hypothetical protein